MKVGLFIPCYVDQLYPQVAIATLQLLEKEGISVYYPLDQTCCGQPMANSGFGNVNNEIDDLFRRNFASCDFIVCPSGSCTLHVKDHVFTTDEHKGKVYELVEFLHDVVKVKRFDARFPYNVGIHNSCHGLRGLRLASSGERNTRYFNKTEALLRTVEGINICDLQLSTECCGFGGTFAVMEEDLSVKMGNDKIKDYEIHNVEVVTSNDMSCLMHMEGLVSRSNRNIRFLHVAQILNGEKI